MKLMMVTVAGLAAAGCGGDDSGPGVDAAPASLVGTWDSQSAADVESELRWVRFDADGAFTIMLFDGRSQTGSYTLDGGRLSRSYDPEASPVIVSEVVFDDGALVLDALVPVTPALGLVASWRNVTVTDGETETTTLTLEADRSASLDLEGVGHLAGSWTPVSFGVEFHSNPAGFDRTYHKLGTVGLGAYWFVRR